MTVSDEGQFPSLLPWVDEGGRALDLQDVNRRAGRDDRLLVVGPRRPFLAADPDPPAVRGHFGKHLAGLADQRRRSGPQPRRPRCAAERSA